MSFRVPLFKSTKRWLEQGLAHPGGLVPLFTGEAEPVDEKLVKHAFLNGWVEAFPASRDGTVYLACRLTQSGRSLIQKEGAFGQVTPESGDIKGERSEELSDTEALILATLRAAGSTSINQPTAKPRWAHQRLAVGAFLIVVPALAALIILLDPNSDILNEGDNSQTPSQTVEARTDDTQGLVDPNVTEGSARKTQSKDQLAPTDKELTKQPDQTADSNPAAGQSANSAGNSGQERYWEGIVNLMVNEPSDALSESEKTGQSLVAEAGDLNSESTLAQESVPPPPTLQVPIPSAAAPPASAEAQIPTSNEAAPKEGEVVAESYQRAESSPINKGSGPTPSTEGKLAESNANGAADLSGQNQINETKSFSSDTNGPTPHSSETGKAVFSLHNRQRADGDSPVSSDVKEAKPRSNEETVVSALSSNPEFGSIDPDTDAPSLEDQGGESNSFVSLSNDLTSDQIWEGEGKEAPTLSGGRTDQTSARLIDPEEKAEADPKRAENPEGQTDRGLIETSSSASTTTSLIEDAPNNDEKLPGESSSSQSSDLTIPEPPKGQSNNGTSVSDETGSDAKSGLKTHEILEESATPKAEEIVSTEGAIKDVQGASTDSSSKVASASLANPAPTIALEAPNREARSEEKDLSSEDHFGKAQTVVDSQSDLVDQAEIAEDDSAKTPSENEAASLPVMSATITGQANNPSDQEDVAPSAAQKNNDQAQTEQEETIASLSTLNKDQEQNTEKTQLGLQQQNDTLKAAPQRSGVASGLGKERKLLEGEGKQPLELSPSENPPVSASRSASESDSKHLRAPKQSAVLSINPRPSSQTKPDKTTQVPKNERAALAAPSSEGNDEEAIGAAASKPKSGDVQSSELQDRTATFGTSNQEKNASADSVQSASSPPLAEPEFTVQFASLDSKDAGQKAAELIGNELEKILGELELHVVKGVVSGRTYFRVRTQKNLSLEAATDVCRKSKARGQDCFVSKN